MTYNKEHNITPTTIDKPIREELIKDRGEHKQGEIPGTWEKKNARDNAKNGYQFPKHETTNKTELKLGKNHGIYLEDIVPEELTPQDRKKLASQLGRTMNNAAKAWNFELAAQIRDVIAKLEN